MSGKINKIIVKMMVEAGIMAVGISGIDAGILRAIRKTKLTVLNEKGRKMIIEGGYTGKIQSVETSLLNTLTENGYLPVVSPIALSEQAKEYLPKIGFGMEKKILASTEALMLGAKEVIIASGKVSNPISSAINHEDCTVISN